MSGRTTRQLLRSILAEIDRVAGLIEECRTENFCKDKRLIAAVTDSVRAISSLERGIPTIIRVKYALVPWTELAGLEDTIIRWDPGTRPRLLWKISTETLPRIRPIVENLLKEMEN